MTGRALLVLAVALGAVSAGFWAFRTGGPGWGAGSASSPPVIAPFATTTSRPEMLEPRPASIPTILPDFALSDRGERPRRLADWRGQPLIVNFWATWCAPCRREIPLLTALRQERQAERLEVIGIAVDSRPAVLEYADRIGLDYPLLIGEADGLAAIEAFGMETVFPFTVFADRQHRIVALKIGELHRDEADFVLDRMQDVDAGRLTLEGARARIAARLPELATERARRRSRAVGPRQHEAEIAANRTQK